MAYLSQENKNRIRQYIQGLDGISQAEWNELKKAVNNTFDSIESEQAKKNVLTVNENALNYCDKFEVYNVDLRKDLKC